MIAWCIRLARCCICKRRDNGTLFERPITLLEVQPSLLPQSALEAHAADAPATRSVQPGLRCAEPRPPVSKASSMSASSGSSALSQHVGATEETLDESPYMAAGETCGTQSVQVDSSTCYRPRTCRSCLKKLGCVISQYGTCETEAADVYDASTDFRLAYMWNLVLPNGTTSNYSAILKPQHWRFSAADAKYCLPDDAMCMACVKAKFWAPSIAPDSRFCVGNNGCVCVSVCEAKDYEAPINCAPLATPYPSSDLYDDTGTSTTIKIIGFVMGSLLLMMAACLFRCIRRDYDHRRRLDSVRSQQRLEREAQRQRRLERQLRSVSRVNALSLSGWKSYRQTAIQKEKSRRGGESIDTNTSVSSAYIAIQDSNELRQASPGNPIHQDHV